jgi:DNA-binding transcriptional LysR family regulator
MPRDNFADLLAFIAVARERSFTRAAARLGVSQSALSHTIRSLETRLGVRLLTRTTRSVAPTEAGERLLQNLAPRFDEIEAELSALAELRDKPAGTVRINATDYVIRTLLWPKLSPVLRDYRDLKVEFVTDYGLSDIVAQRFDIGVRLGDQVAKDMIAVRISPDIRMAMVASPAYLDGRKPPKTPQDLLDHDCVTLRLATAKGIYAWELKKGRNAIQARVNGRITCNTQPHMVQAALDGFGIAFVTEDIVLDHVRSGRLRIVMPDWCPAFPGYHAYYPSRRQASRAFSIVIDALRYRA